MDDTGLQMIWKVRWSVKLKNRHDIPYWQIEERLFGTYDKAKVFFDTKKPYAHEIYPVYLY